ncbi:MAG TPA: sigma 54-interacting transcriptional regulator [Polyangia bacterium]|nr:sigma 54-interacting transcriptional regulator [Polyangia bacterium]
MEFRGDGEAEASTGWPQLGQAAPPLAEFGPLSSVSACDLAQHFPGALLIVDRGTRRILHASRVALEELGLEARAPDRPRLDEAIDARLPGTIEIGQPFSVGCRWVATTGEPFEVHVRIAAVSAFTWLALVRRGRDPLRIAEELREANRFLEAVVENIPDMIFVKRASDHTFFRFNRAAEELLGWDRQQLFGKSDYDVFPREEADFFRAKDLEIYAKGELLEIPEEPISTREKGVRWLRTKKVPVYDGDRPLYLVGISEDITERKLAAERARALERELAAVVVKANDAIVTWTPDGHIVSCNPAAEQLYGISAAQAGLTIDALVPANLRPELQASTERLLAGQKLPVSQTYRLRGSREIEVEESLSLIPGAGDRPARIASIARDIGEIARLRRAAEILAGAATEDDPVSLAPAMREVVDAADVVAQDGYASVLLLGETGVGKSWLARRIHRRSARDKKPFLDINCASLAPQLLESELFGYERGAFTGATAAKRGLVEAADGGTLLLDEVGELPMSVQAQLLTFLDEHRFRRVGGTRIIQADVRILAATNVNLADRVASGQFRKDLYYRLSVVPIQIPPLRERREEIPALARSILAELGRRASRRVFATIRQEPSVNALSPGVTAALQRYDWPGNLRELRNTLERALILSRGDTISLCHLPPELVTAAPPGDRSLRLQDVQRAHIVRVLESCGGNRTRAAEVLGISRSTLKRTLAEMSGAAGRAGGPTGASIGHDGDDGDDD